MSISSLPNEIVFCARLPDFDMGEIRAIQTKAQETGFIRASQLMKLQKAGFKRSLDVPPRPTPKDRRRLKERARQKMFIGEPRSLLRHQAVGISIAPMVALMSPERPL
jgi:hypothetical protein